MVEPKLSKRVEAMVELSAVLEQMDSKLAQWLCDEKESGASILEREKLGRKDDEALGLSLVEAIESHLSKKLYHEAMDAVEEFLFPDAAHESRTKLYKSWTADPVARIKFLCPVLHNARNKVDPLRTYQLITRISAAMAPTESIQTLDACVSWFDDNLEATLGWLAAMLTHLVRGGFMKAAERVFEDLNEIFNETVALDVGVSSVVHDAKANYFLARDENEEFYKNRLLYLAYTPTGIIEFQERVRMGIDLLIAVLVSKTMFSFGEVLELPLVVSVLDKTEDFLDKQKFGTLTGLTKALNSASLAEYGKTRTEYHEVLKEIKLIENARETIDQKMRMMCLMELAFNKPTGRKVLSFNEIASECRIDIQEVELLVMKSMKNKLIRGKVNEVEEIVQVTWVKPKVLDSERIRQLTNRISEWVDLTQGLSKHMEMISADVVHQLV